MRIPVGICSVALPLILCGGALADSVWVGTLERKDVKIQNFRNGVVEFTISGRAVDPVAADRITRLSLDDEPVFTQADLAFAEGNVGSAADGYATVLKSTTKPWLKDWVLPRLLQAADRAGRLDLATGTFVQLAGKDLNAAMRFRPAIPERTDANQLAAAASELKRASGVAGVSPAVRQAVLSMLLDISRAQGDLAGASAVAEQLLKSIPSDLSDPVVAHLAADIHLNVARLAMTQKDFARAQSQIESNRQLFSEPAQQAEALYCLAAARDALSDKSPESLKDCALDYMRVVAVARQSPGKRYVPESLMRVAQIQEQLGDTKSASALYAEVATQYKGSPIGASAAREQQRLNQKTGM